VIQILNFDREMTLETAGLTRIFVDSSTPSAVRGQHITIVAGTSEATRCVATSMMTRDIVAATFINICGKNVENANTQKCYIKHANMVKSAAHAH
jgi:hypothetical protein